jgi:hypothetical protein
VLIDVLGEWYSMTVDAIQRLAGRLSTFYTALRSVGGHARALYDRRAFA